MRLVSLEQINAHTYIALSSVDGRPLIIKAARRICDPRIWRQLTNYCQPAMTTCFGIVKLPENQEGYCFEYRSGRNVVEICQKLNCEGRWQLISEIFCEYHKLQKELESILSRPIIHGDLKPQHIFKSASGQIFFVDWEQARFCGCYYPQVGINAYYSAPELLIGKAHINSDLYSLGKVASTLCFEKSLSTFDREDKNKAERKFLLEQIAVLKQAIDKNPAKRRQSVEYFWQRNSKKAKF